MSISRGKFLDTSLLVASAVVIALLAWRVSAMSADARAASAANRGWDDSMKLQRLFRGGAEEIVLHLPSPAIYSGADAKSGERRSISADAHSGLVYSLSPSCAACAENFGVLRELAGRFPGRVLAVTEAPVADAHVAYDTVSNWFPVLAGFELKSATPLFPKGVHPVALLVRGTRRIQYFYGKIDSKDAKRIERELASNP